MNQNPDEHPVESSTPVTPPTTPGLPGQVSPTQAEQPKTDDEPEPDPLALRLLEEYLQEREAVCPVCQYQLHGVRGGKCPECGVPIELQVASPRRRMGPWLVGLLSVSMVGGFFSIATIITMYFSLFYGMLGRTTEDLMLVLLWVCAFVYDVGVVLIIKRRAAFWKAPKDIQDMRATICAMAAIIPAVVYLLIMFNL